MTGKEKALLILKNKKQNAAENRDAFLDKMKADPDFSELYSENQTLKWDYVKARTEQDKAELQLKIDENESKISSFLSARGYAKNRLEIQYDCSVCSDSGFIRGKECDCLKKLRIGILEAENGITNNIPIGLNKIDFMFYGDEEKEKRKYADVINESLNFGRKIFLLAGKTGTAKTYFANACLRGLLHKDKEVKILTAIKLNKLLLDYHCAPLSEKRNIWEEIETPDALLIDDLGAEQILNNVTVPYLLELLTDRIEKITFITTNLSPKDLETKYGQRIMSRLLDKKLSLPIVFDGQDLRLL